MYCGYCLSLTPVRLTRVSETQPLGYKGGLGPVVFEALESSKRRRIKHREDNEVFNVEDYPIAGKEDNDLTAFANQRIVLSVQDSENGDSAEGEGDQSSDSANSLIRLIFN